MDPQHTFCPNLECPARGQVGRGNIRIHSQADQRYRCTLCRQTFTASHRTVFFRAHADRDLIVLVLALLGQGCPLHTIETVFGLQARTVRRWQQRAGEHCQQVHQELVAQPQDLGQVQADELRVRTQLPWGCGGVLWLAMASAVPTRLWLGAVVSAHRDKHLLRALAALIRACAHPGPLLLVVDGLQTYVGALRRAFRDPVHTGERKRPRLRPWPQVVIGQVLKQYGRGRWGRRLVRGVRRHLVQGRHALLRQLLRATQDKGEGGVLNTAYIERLNGTFRARLGALVRRTRGLVRRPAMLTASAYLVGTLYNFCTYHQSLGTAAGTPRTPAMAAGLTDHCWSVAELLWHRVPPPRWTPPKRRGRRSKALQELIEKWAK